MFSFHKITSFFLLRKHQLSNTLPFSLSLKHSLTNVHTTTHPHTQHTHPQHTDTLTRMHSHPCTYTQHTDAQSRFWKRQTLRSRSSFLIRLLKVKPVLIQRFLLKEGKRDRTKIWNELGMSSSNLWGFVVKWSLLPLFHDSPGFNLASLNKLQECVKIVFKKISPGYLFPQN